MSKVYRNLNSEQILKDIRKSFKIISCIDISEDFEYEDMFVYDCMIETTMVNVGVKEDGKIRVGTLREFSLFEQDINQIIESIINALDVNLKIKYPIEDANIEYKLYTFFDYVYSINFVLIVDFSGKDKKVLKYIKENIKNIQLMGKSKYLN